MQQLNSIIHNDICYGISTWLNIGRVHLACIPMTHYHRRLHEKNLLHYNSVHKQTKVGETWVW